MIDAGWGRGPDGQVFRKDGQEVCDFCLAPGPTWEFPAAPMPVHGHFVIGASVDEWAACDTCKELIVASKLGALIEHCVSTQRELWPTGTPGTLPSGARGVVAHPPLPLHRRQMRENLLRFLDARTGPPRAYESRR